MKHSIYLSGYQAKPQEKNLKLGTRDSYGTEELQLVIGPEWKGLTITATFHPPGNRNNPVRVLADSKGMVKVPPEATVYSNTASPEFGRIVFTGIAEDVQRISLTLRYDVEDHAPVEGDESTATPTLLDQVIAQTGAARDKAIASAFEAKQWSTRAADCAEAAEQAKAAAERAASIVKSSAVAVENAQEEALTSVDDSKNAALNDLNLARIDAVKAVDNSQNNAVTSLTQQQVSATKGIEYIQATAQQEVCKKKDEALGAIAEAQTEAIKKVIAESSIQSDQLKNLIPDIYNKISSLIFHSTVSGNPVACEESKTWSILALHIYGKSTQNGTPSPENPVPIVNAGDDKKIEVLINGSPVPSTARGDYNTPSTPDLNATLDSLSSESYQSQSLLLDTSGGLLGIPVDNGGNFTDADGQQWISDIVDIHTGYTRYLKSKTINGDDTYGMVFRSPETGFSSCSILVPDVLPGQKILSNRFPWTPNSWAQVQRIGISSLNDKIYIQIYDYDVALGKKTFSEYFSEYPTKIIYPLTVPTTAPFSPEEQETCSSLTTYEGTTVISTLAPIAGLEVSYALDGNHLIAKGKLYLSSFENRLAALENAQAKI